MRKIRRIPSKGYPFHERALMNLAGERWKDISGFEGLYQVSDHGRVKALSRYVEIDIPRRGTIRYQTKELIRKQTVGKSHNNYLEEDLFYLTVALIKAGVGQGFTVARLVFQTFRKDKRIQVDRMRVIHKDGDPFNNKVSNLALASQSEIGKKSHQDNRRQSHFASLAPGQRRTYTRKAVEVNWKPVTQYDLQGRRVAVYKSIREAAKAVNGNPATLSNALAGRIHRAAGFIWKQGRGKARIDTSSTREMLCNLHRHSYKPVAQFSRNRKRLGEFSSIKEAARAVGGSSRQISEAVNGRSKSAYGFVWTFIN